MGNQIIVMKKLCFKEDGSF